jgi:hypothetical protein
MIGGPNEIFSRVLTEAGRTRDMQSAIRRMGLNLSPEEKTMLLSLTKEELQALQTINEKLAPLGVSIARTAS